MIPQDQEFLVDKEKGIRGDCARAVIASLLELPIKEVPHFLKEAENDPLGQAYGFYNRIEIFLEARGYEMDWYCNLDYKLKPGIDIYHQISGPSPRGADLFHAVVGLNGKIFFDPHPSRAGLLGDSSEWRHSFLRRI